jgi:hypothetical protein
MSHVSTAYLRRAYELWTVRGVVLVLAVFAAVSGLLLADTRQAAAGGPTSVLIVSRERQITASAYFSMKEYDILLQALDPAPVRERGAPDRELGPGGQYINVTWLWHDVGVWRVDRVFVEGGDEVWINTVQTDLQGEFRPDARSIWHRSPKPKALLALLASWGMVGDETGDAPDRGFDGEPAGNAVDNSAPTTGSENSSQDTAVPAADRNVGVSRAASEKDDGEPWTGLAALGVGLLIGLVSWPVMNRLRKAGANSVSAGPRQQLIDM